jgi:radical SAM superfamily enzyme YgiQ (UPF0313 family)
MDLNQLNKFYFETGPIRPPSEAYSLLIRATRNCPWNRCEFCTTYKGEKFELRSVEDIIKDIGTARKIVDGIKEFAYANGYAGRDREIAAYIYNQFTSSDCVRQVALWQYAGGSSAFLQDANSVIMRTPDLVKVLTELKSTFPQINRITSYCRSKTAAKKTVAELKELKEAGLSRIHIGMESGSDEVLKLVNKGMTAEDHIKGGRNVKEAGIELSEYYMPGLGGRRLWLEHASETARVLNEINPDFIRLRTLMIGPQLVMWSKVESGEFEVMSEDEIIREIGEFISRLEFTGELKSDHVLNLLPELEGKFPEAKHNCLNVINRYLSFPLKERLNYRLGRRAGVYEMLDDLYDADKYEKVDKALKRVGADTDEKVDQLIEEIKQRFI